MFHVEQYPNGYKTDGLHLTRYCKAWASKSNIYIAFRQTLKKVHIEFNR